MGARKRNKGTLSDAPALEQSIFPGFSSDYYAGVDLRYRHSRASPFERRYFSPTAATSTRPPRASDLLGPLRGLDAKSPFEDLANRHVADGLRPLGLLIAPVIDAGKAAVHPARIMGEPAVDASIPGISLERASWAALASTGLFSIHQITTTEPVHGFGP